MKHRASSTVRLLVAILREIFDEAGYARFLARKQMPSSGEAYAAFLHEKNGIRPQPRCC